MISSSWNWNSQYLPSITIHPCYVKDWVKVDFGTQPIILFTFTQLTATHTPVFHYNCIDFGTRKVIAYTLVTCNTVPKTHDMYIYSTCRSPIFQYNIQIFWYWPTAREQDGIGRVQILNGRIYYSPNCLCSVNKPSVCNRNNPFLSPITNKAPGSATKWTIYLCTYRLLGCYNTTKLALVSHQSTSCQKQIILYFAAGTPCFQHFSG